jgi:hypothetical protein
MDGSIVPGWPKHIQSNFPFGPVLADLNSDGKNEIFFAHINWSAGNEPHGVISRLNGNGEPLPGWPITLRQSGPTASDFLPLAMPTIADANSDGKKDVVVGLSGKYNRREAVLLAWNENGTPVTGWRRTLQTTNRFTEGAGPGTEHPEQAIVSVDLNGDRSLEYLLAGSLFGDVSFLYGINAQGSALANWPIDVESFRQATFVSFAGNIAVGNIIADSKPEVVAVDRYGKVWALSLDGRLLPGWPKQLPLKLLGTANESVTAVGSPTLIDLDGDGVREITIEKAAWHGNGTPVAGWGWSGHEKGRDLFGGNAVADVDGDNISDIVIPQTGQQGIAANPQLTEAWGAPFHLFATTRNGSNVSQWPKALPWAVDGHPVAEDLDGNGTMEVVTVMSNGQILIYSTPGRASAGTWPQINKDAQHTRGYTPAAAPTPTFTPSPAPPLGCPGDYNNDRKVDAADYSAWRRTQGQRVAPGTGADGNRNGVIDNGDYTVWRANFGKTCSAAPPPAPAPAPPPAAPAAPPPQPIPAPAPPPKPSPAPASPPPAASAPVACNLPGDYNKDRRVDNADFVVWYQNRGRTGVNVADGSGNRFVDLADYYLWRNNIGRSC